MSATQTSDPAGETTGAPALRERLRALHRRMCEGLIERDEPARVLLLAALAGEHVLLLGPPGTAKSELARRLRGCIAEGIYFERLLTRFSVPEELFGPLSIKALEQDEYVRLTEGYLPAASVAFLDEIFNANSAILNALLTLLNEREFDNGARRVATPLVSVVAATNHVPDAPELAALHDRFLFRCHVTPVSADGFLGLLDVPPSPRPADARAPRLTLAEMDEIRRRAAGVSLSPSARSLLASMRALLAEKGLYVSDRRWRRIANVLRVAALCDDRRVVTLADGPLMLHGLWDRPEHIEVVEGALAATLDAALVDEPRRHEAMVEAFEAEIDRELRCVEHACDDEGRPLYLDEAGERVTEPYHRRPVTNADGVLLFEAPPDMASPRRRFTMGELWEEHFQNKVNGWERLEAWVKTPLHQAFARELRAPVTAPARYPAEHVAARRRQLEELLGDVDGFLSGISAAHGGVGPSLWVSEARHGAVARRLGASERSLSALRARLRSLVDRLAELPVKGA
ncbi:MULTISPECIES: AAA family ATPase [Sorangium]|uniref:AAA+ ATPase domain-containing protein n=1 Tax=Sorangium cellulosum TaxID=56 RepID=A0A4P2QPL2_SORCE|nr:MULTISPECIES: AAA family ATPase [Sorangium]AUX31886.1 uncharacterized protein SOCE836_040190 [Sorangium cellulosum]WCQ91260.1 ATPase [Sorangium sp. Soce836]